MLNLEKVDTIMGTFYGFPSDLITSQLKTFGAHQRNELAMLLSCIREGDVILDVGANIGTFAIPLAKKAGSAGKLYGFEGDKEIFSVLQKNIEENELQDCIKIKNCIVTQNPGSFRKINVEGNAGATHFIREENQADDGIDAVSLDDWCEQNSILTGNINVLKIDVEGMDADVLFSGKKLITTKKPVIYIEISSRHLKENGYSYAQVENFLKENGYEFYRNIGPRNSQNDDYSIIKLSSLGSGGAFYDLLAIPKGTDRVPDVYKKEWYILIWKLRQIPRNISKRLRKLIRKLKA